MNSVNILQCTCVPVNISNSESKGVEIFMPNRFPKGWQNFYFSWSVLCIRRIEVQDYFVGMNIRPKVVDYCSTRVNRTIRKLHSLKCKLLMNVQFIVGCKQKRPLTSSRLVVIWSAHGMKNAVLCTV